LIQTFLDILLPVTYRILSCNDLIISEKQILPEPAWSMQKNLAELKHHIRLALPAFSCA